MVVAQAKTPKYKAKAVYWNTITKIVVDNQTIQGYRKLNGRLDIPKCIERFDSQHEFRVYLELVRMYGAKCVIRQYPLLIVDECLCYPKGKEWKVDFAIKALPSSYMPCIYVEAKGAFLPEFAYTLALFEQTLPEDFYSLTIVFSDKVPKENRVIKNLLKSSIKDQLITLKQLKDSIRL